MRTAEADQNYLSLDKEHATFYAGTDAWFWLAENGPIPTTLLPPNPKDWDSILKLSGRKNTTLRGLVVDQGKENSLDVNNRSSQCVLIGYWGAEGDEGEQVITIKGGSHDITVGGNVYSRGTDCDIEIGAYSDQSFATSYNIDLSALRRADGKPLTVVLGRVNSPLKALFGKPKDIKLPANCKVLFWGSLGEQIYWWAKYLLVKTTLIRWIKI